MAGVGLGFGSGTDCPRCFCENALRAEANAAGTIGVTIVCTHCKKVWNGGWSAVERTRTAMSRPGYIENELSNELQNLIKIASANALDTAITGIDLAIVARESELKSTPMYSNVTRYTELATQIKTLTDMRAWMNTLKESYEK